ncbi:MAG: DUF427 domain-containing protein [Solirubrobacteraceae bacterium]
MGLAWQQGPLAPGAIGRFLIPAPLPERLLFAEPLRRRMRVLFGESWIATSDDVVLLHEPGRYPVAYFPQVDIAGEALHPSERVTEHRELGDTAWYVVRAGGHEARRGAWQHINLPDYADALRDRVAFAWHAMDAFYEEEDRIVGHAADAYHRIDIRRTARELVVCAGDQVIAQSHRPLVLYESGFAPRWYVPRTDVNQTALSPVHRQTFCPYKGLCSYYDIGESSRAAWSYREAYDGVRRISDFVSFEPDKLAVTLDGVAQQLDSGQNVVPHGADRGLTPAELVSPTMPSSPSSPSSSHSQEHPHERPTVDRVRRQRNPTGPGLS